MQLLATPGGSMALNVHLGQKDTALFLITPRKSTKLVVIITQINKTSGEKLEKPLIHFKMKIYQQVKILELYDYIISE